MKKIKVDKVILYYMDRVDPDGNLYGMRQKRKDVFESPDGLYIEMVYENKAFVSYRPIKET